MKHEWEECIIFVQTREESERVQKILFAAGAEWPLSGQAVRCTGSPFLLIDSNGQLGHTGSFGHIGRNCRSAKFIDSFHATADTFPPLKPENMITIEGEEHTEAALGVMARYYRNREKD